MQELVPRVAITDNVSGLKRVQSFPITDLLFCPVSLCGGRIFGSILLSPARVFSMENSEHHSWDITKFHFNSLTLAVKGSSVLDLTLQSYRNVDINVLSTGSL